MRVKAIAELPVNLEDGSQSHGKLISFEGSSHVALVFDRPEGSDPEEATLVRIHSRCMTGESLGSARCDCQLQLRAAKQALAKGGGGLIYMEDEGRGIGLPAKVHAYQLQDEGLDTFEANLALGFGLDHRDFSAAGAMLKALGIYRIRIISGNPKKVEALRTEGIEVVEAIVQPLDAAKLSELGHRYLQTKIRKASHNIKFTKEGCHK